jgi:cell division protein FtsW
VFLLASHPALAKFQWLAFALLVIGLLAVGFLLTEGGLSFLMNLNILKDYQLARFENTVDPFINRYGTGYQLVSSLMAFVKGDWFGVGLGMSLQKYGYLPAAQTDFILAVIAEELGFIGVLVVAGLTLFIIVTLLRYAFSAKTDRPRMVLAGVAYYLLIHFIFNVGGVTALLPLTGVPLLLISSGGSSTLSVMMALGIAQRMIIDQKASEDA